MGPGVTKLCSEQETVPLGQDAPHYDPPSITYRRDMATAFDLQLQTIRSNNMSAKPPRQFPKPGSTG